MRSNVKNYSQIRVIKKSFTCLKQLDIYYGQVSKLLVKLHFHSNKQFWLHQALRKIFLSTPIFYIIECPFDQ